MSIYTCIYESVRMKGRAGLSFVLLFEVAVSPSADCLQSAAAETPFTWQVNFFMYSHAPCLFGLSFCSSSSLSLSTFGDGEPH